MCHDLVGRINGDGCALARSAMWAQEGLPVVDGYVIFVSARERTCRVTPEARRRLCALVFASFSVLANMLGRVVSSAMSALRGMAKLDIGRSPEGL